MSVVKFHFTFLHYGQPMLLHVLFQVFYTSWSLFLILSGGINIDLTQEEKYHSYYPTGNYEFLWKDFNSHIWGKMASLFSLPGVGKPLSRRLNHPESFIHLWKSHRNNFPNCMFLNRSRSTIKLGNKADFLIHWYFVKTTFLGVILFLVHSSSFHYHSSSCDFRRNFYE